MGVSTVFRNTSDRALYRDLTDQCNSVYLRARQLRALDPASPPSSEKDAALTTFETLHADLTDIVLEAQGKVGDLAAQSDRDATYFMTRGYDLYHDDPMELETDLVFACRVFEALNHLYGPIRNAFDGSSPPSLEQVVEWSSHLVDGFPAVARAFEGLGFEIATLVRWR